MSSDEEELAELRAARSAREGGGVATLVRTDCYQMQHKLRGMQPVHSVLLTMPCSRN